MVLDVSQNSELMIVIERIHSRRIKYNEERGLPYPLVMSMGYAVYDTSSKMTLEEFQKHIDHLMYQDKEANRSKNIPFITDKNV